MHCPNRNQIWKVAGVMVLTILINACASSNKLQTQSTHYYQTSLDNTVNTFQQVIKQVQYDINDHEQVDDKTYRIMVSKRSRMGVEDPQSKQMEVTIQEVAKNKIKVNIDRQDNDAALYAHSYDENYERQIFDRLDSRLKLYTASNE